MFRRLSLAHHLQIQNKPILFDSLDKNNLLQMLNISDTIENANGKHLKTRLRMPVYFDIEVNNE
jgi:hypothetical protein